MLICPELISDLANIGKRAADNLLLGIPVHVLAISKYILVDKCDIKKCFGKNS